MQRLRQISARKGVSLSLVRQGKHEIWQLGSLTFAVPRHNEIAEGTARAILGQAEKL